MIRGYPREVVLRNGKRVLLRPFAQGDAEALFAFFTKLPTDVRRFAWDHIDDPRVVETWAQNIDYAKVLPLLAVDGSGVVADASLHRREGGPLRLSARIKWLIHPEYRGQGLGTALVNDFIDIGRQQGLRHLTCMLIEDLEADAVETLTNLGFEKYSMPGYGTDPDGDAHDMVKLILAL